MLHISTACRFGVSWQFVSNYVSGCYNTTFKSYPFVFQKLLFRNAKAILSNCKTITFAIQRQRTCHILRRNKRHY